MSNERPLQTAAVHRTTNHAPPSTPHAGLVHIITVRSVEVFTMKKFSGRAFALILVLASGLAVACSDDDPTGSEDSHSKRRQLEARVVLLDRRFARP